MNETLHGCLRIKKFSISSLIFLILVLPACNSECEKIYIEKSERIWVENLNQGDTILFANDRFDTIGFVLSESSNDFTLCNKIEVSDYQFEHMSRTYTINDTSEEKIDLQIAVYKDSELRTEKRSHKYINFYNMIVRIQDTSHLRRQSITLPSNERINTFFFENENLETEPVAFNWSVKLGLIKFQLRDEETYLRIK